MRRDEALPKIVIVIVGIVAAVALGSCSGNRKETFPERDVPPVSESSYDSPVEVVQHDSVSREMSRKVIAQSVAVSHDARTADEAYDEGYDVGREDGEEDGMNNDPEFSYDDSCPYKGKMRKAYKRGYRDGYDEGLEDGLEEYDLTKEPWEEDTDW